MKNPLTKRFKRDLISNKGRYFAIFLMLTVTIAIMSGFLAVAAGAQRVLFENRVNCQVEDGSFTVLGEVSRDARTSVEKLGVTIYENNYLEEELTGDTTLKIYPDREHINLVTVINGQKPVTSDEIALDRLFAESYGFNIGDSLTIDGKLMEITGTISLPDYSSLFKNNSDLMMDSFHLGVGIVTPEAFADFPESITAYSYRYNDRSLNISDKRDLSEHIIDKLVENGVTLSGFVTAENNQRISFIDDDMGSDIPMMKVFLSVILIIMAFVFAIVIISTIEGEAALIGTLLASGYTRFELIRHYMTLPVAVTLASAVVGNLCGYLLLPDFFIGMYEDSYCLPPIPIKLNWEALLLTTILPLALMAVINFVTLFRKLSISPLNFMRKELGKNKQQRNFKLPAISFFWRYRVRVIIQNKATYLTLFIGVFLAIFILMFGLSLNPTINHYIKTIKESAVADYQYLLKAPIPAENPGDAEKMTVAGMEIYYPPAGKTIEVFFWGLSEDSRYFSDLPLSDAQSGVYLSDGLATKLGAKAGDKLDFVNPDSNHQYTVEVIGITDFPGGLTVFMNQSQLNTLLAQDKNYFNGYFSDRALTFSDQNAVATVITPEYLSKIGDQMLSSFSQLAPLCLLVAIIIYLVLMMVLTKLVIDKNALYISYLKVFGYEGSEIRKLYLRATTIVVIAALILPLPLVSFGIKSSFFLVQMKLSGYLPVYQPFYLFAMIVAIGIIAYLIINFFHVRHINKIQLSAAIKNRE